MVFIIVGWGQRNRDIWINSLFFCWYTVFLCSPGWPKTYDPPISVSLVLRLQGYNTLSKNHPWIIHRVCKKSKGWSLQCDSMFLSAQRRQSYLTEDLMHAEEFCLGTLIYSLPPVVAYPLYGHTFHNFGMSFESPHRHTGRRACSHTPACSCMKGGRHHTIPSAATLSHLSSSSRVSLFSTSIN